MESLPSKAGVLRGAVALAASLWCSSCVGNLDCPAGTENCSGVCVELGTERHCRECFDSCAPGLSCDESRGCSCPGEQRLCGTRCVDLLASPSNCGRCGNDCGEASCVSGSCQCPGGFLDCDGRCVDGSSDPLHCGACNTRCDAPRACVAGSCVCPDGELFCDGSCVAITTDELNCGRCGRRCLSEQSCLEGLCECPGSLTACAGRCRDFDTDRSHCGSCGSACSAFAGQYCSSARCRPSIAWALGYGGGNDNVTVHQRSVAVGVDPVTDRIYVGWSIAGSFSSALRVAAFEPDGTELWTQTVNGLDRDADPQALAVRAGKVLVGTRAWNAEGEAFLLDVSTGGLIDRWTVGTAVTDVAIGADGTLVLAGEYRDAVFVDEVALSARSWHTVFVMRFDADNVAQSAISLGNGSVSDGPAAIALAEDGSVYLAADAGGLTGYYDGMTLPESGWLLKLAPDDSLDWVVPFDVQDVWGLDLGTTLTVHAWADYTTIAGVDLGRDTFVAGFEPDSGVARFATVYDYTGGDQPGMAAGDPRVLATPGLGSIDVGGRVRWRLPLTGIDGQSVALGSDFAVVAGRYDGALTLTGGTELESVGRDGVAIIRVDL